MSHYVCEHCGDTKQAALDICTDPALRCKTAERLAWVIEVCPLCKGRVNGNVATHVGDCPNRERAWRVEEIGVVPASERDRLQAALHDAEQAASAEAELADQRAGEVVRLAGEVERLREALKEYAEHQSWRCGHPPHYYLAGASEDPPKVCPCGLDQELIDLGISDEKSEPAPGDGSATKGNAESEARYPTSAELHEVVDGLRPAVRRCWDDILKFEREHPLDGDHGA